MMPRRARITIGNSRLTCFELPDTFQDALEQIDRFETGDDNRHLVSFDERNVMLATGYRADVTGCQKGLYATIG